MKEDMNTSSASGGSMEHGEHTKKVIPMNGDGPAESGVNVRTEPNNNKYSD